MYKNEVIGTVMIATGVVGLIAISSLQALKIKQLEKELRSTKSDSDFYQLVVKHQLKVMTVEQFKESTTKLIDELEFNHIVKKF